MLHVCYVGRGMRPRHKFGISASHLRADMGADFANFLLRGQNQTFVLPTPASSSPNDVFGGLRTRNNTDAIWQPVSCAQPVIQP
jgi:hypothetical protein